MSYTSHRTAIYNTTSSPDLLNTTFAQRSSYYDYSYTMAGDVVATKRYHVFPQPAIVRVMSIFAEHRSWYSREMQRAGLHHVIERILRTPELAQYLTDWREMLLEYPHTADLDGTKIAYTESDAKGIADRQTVTSLGKYVKRHAPNMPDHVLRDLVALSITSVELVYDLASMIEAVQNGPKSCMQSSQWRTDTHPYRVYDPKYGWHMAVSRAGGEIVGRCLCLTHEGEKMFVRSYKQHPRDDGYSQSDEGTNAWLVQRGYTHDSGWPEGARLACIQDGQDYVLPYIDGDASKCTDQGGYLCIDSDGDIDGCQINGYAENTSSVVSCDDCGYNFDPENEGTWTLYHEDNHVCDSCFENYTQVVGRNGYEYYVHNDDAMHCVSDGVYYDINYLGTNDVVYIDSEGEYYKTDDCTLLVDTNEYVLTTNLDDDEYVCVNEDEDLYAMRDNCWQCVGTGQWYLTVNYTPVIGADGKTYHVDAVPEVVTE